MKKNKKTKKYNRESNGERIIRTYLENKKYYFDYNYRIRVEKTPFTPRGYLYIDFVIYSCISALYVSLEDRISYIACAIEYDGHTSHFDSIKQQNRDRSKENWCHDRGIPLCRLCYEPALKKRCDIEKVIDEFIKDPILKYEECKGMPCYPKELYDRLYVEYEKQCGNKISRRDPNDIILYNLQKKSKKSTFAIILKDVTKLSIIEYYAKNYGANKAFWWIAGSAFYGIKTLYDGVCNVSKKLYKRMIG